jgi:hypothetical protein
VTAVPLPRTWAAGEVISSSRLNVNISDVLTFLSNPPIVECNQTVAQSYATGSTPSVGLTFTTEVVDSSGMHSTSVNTSRFVAVYPGWYEWTGGVGFVANATGSRGADWATNGAQVNGSFVWLPCTTSGFAATPARTKKIFLNATDYVELWAGQTSGGTLNTSVVNIEQSSVSGKWISN